MFSFNFLLCIISFKAALQIYSEESQFQEYKLIDIIKQQVASMVFFFQLVNEILFKVSIQICLQPIYTCTCTYSSIAEFNSLQNLIPLLWGPLFTVPLSSGLYLFFLHFAICLLSQGEVLVGKSPLHSFHSSLCCLII